MIGHWSVGGGQRGWRHFGPVRARRPSPPFGEGSLAETPAHGHAAAGAGRTATPNTGLEPARLLDGATNARGRWCLRSHRHLTTWPPPERYCPRSPTSNGHSPDVGQTHASAEAGGVAVPHYESRLTRRRQPAVPSEPPVTASPSPVADPLRDPVTMQAPRASGVCRTAGDVSPWVAPGQRAPGICPLSGLR